VVFFKIPFTNNNLENNNNKCYLNKQYLTTRRCCDVIGDILLPANISVAFDDFGDRWLVNVLQRTESLDSGYKTITSEDLSTDVVPVSVQKWR